MINVDQGNIVFTKDKPELITDLVILFRSLFQTGLFEIDDIEPLFMTVLLSSEHFDVELDGDETDD